ncbi:hypothetical protein AVEN_155270-1 [Araneus ventricosus]|uniref:Uncharacterized protein n=1 Tax=Araneus ventricosus TaxID=182803 RepID=A0A4Y2D854_ARAVE|nr:hypothetical protein AVEN_155270-1 [Araneus ventricosus]
MNWTLLTWVVNFLTNPAPAITFPYGARKRAVVGKDNWTTYLLSNLRTSPPLKRRLLHHFRDVKGLEDTSKIPYFIIDSDQQVANYTPGRRYISYQKIPCTQEYLARRGTRSVRSKGTTVTSGFCVADD